MTASFHTARVRQVGRSVMFAIPPGILKQLNLKACDPVTLVVSGDKLIVTRAKSAKYATAKPHTRLLN